MNSVKIGVISDTHLNRITDDFLIIHKDFLDEMDIIIHAGDFVSAEVIHFLESDKFHGVCGNMDPMEVRELLPNKKEIQCGTFRLGVIHGWGSAEGLEERISPEFTNVDAIIYGHSHRPANHVKNGILYFNPGSMTYSLSGPRTIGVLEVSDKIRGRITELK